MSKRIKIGLIGFGRMGRKFFTELIKNDKWEVAYICDISPEAREDAASLAPNAKITCDEDKIFADPEIEVVGLFTLANSRAGQIKKAIAAKKHIIAEKPVADNLESEQEVAQLVEGSGLMVAVNLFNRMAWYHKEIMDFIAAGEIGDLAIIRICHMTPGLIPGEGHEYEGPPFHDCGMHYVDAARMYARSEFATWHSQGVRMWEYKDPWWVQAHGTFKNGVIFDITQGFVYGHLSLNQTHNSYFDIIGTKGTARMTHDFKTARVELRGVTKTLTLEKPFGDKKIDVLCDVFADSVRSGRNEGFPEVKDSVIASEFAWKMLNDAMSNELPVIGTAEELEQIRRRRQSLTDGYGLLKRPSAKTSKKQTIA